MANLFGNLGSDAIAKVAGDKASEFVEGMVSNILEKKDGDGKEEQKGEGFNIGNTLSGLVEGDNQKKGGLDIGNTIGGLMGGNKEESGKSGIADTLSGFLQ